VVVLTMRPAVLGAGGGVFSRTRGGQASGSKALQGEVLVPRCPGAESSTKPRKAATSKRTASTL
jgi:hypothetical protein